MDTATNTTAGNTITATPSAATSSAPATPFSVSASSTPSPRSSTIRRRHRFGIRADGDGLLTQHRGDPAARDAAYHQGTVWPWLIGPYVEARRRAGRRDPADLGGLLDHLGEWVLGSVSETADGDAPHGATGCPFQAWSVAALFRGLRLLTRRL